MKNVIMTVIIMTERSEWLMETTLLLVDDEKKIVESMAEYLHNEGYRIITARTGKEALAVAQAEKPALVVLDWMLPELSGIDVCRALRSSVACGIIMLTAKTEEMDKIVGLEVGADDYMTKPFSLRELAARIRSVLRRIHVRTEEPGMMQRDRLAIHESKYQVLKDDKEVVLTPT